MTRDELIEAIGWLGKRAAPGNPQQSTDRDLGYWEAVVDVLDLAKQLDDQPAMAWQDEPTRWGWHYVDGIGVRDLRKLRDGTWVCKRHGGDKKLNGRRVCPIPAAPPMSKRGDK